MIKNSNNASPLKFDFSVHKILFFPQFLSQNKNNWSYGIVEQFSTLQVKAVFQNFFPFYFIVRYMTYFMKFQEFFNNLCKISGGRKTKKKIEKYGKYVWRESFKNSKTVFVFILAKK